jgi:hypothetical protein
MSNISAISWQVIGEMDSVVVSSAVDGTFNPWSCQTKDFKNKKLYLMLLP